MDLHGTLIKGQKDESFSGLLHEKMTQGPDATIPQSLDLGKLLQEHKQTQENGG